MSPDSAEPAGWSPPAWTDTVRRSRQAVRRALSPLPFPFAAPTWPQSISRPVAAEPVGVEYPTAWARRYPARLVRAVVTDNVTRPAVFALASPLVRGDDLLDLVEAPAIYVANHTSHVDTPLLLSVLPTRVRHRTLVAGAADYFFDRRWKAHLWALVLGVVPIERNRVSRRSVDAAAELLADGWNLVIFPEGGRSSDGWQQPFSGGAAYLAVRTGRPVVPVHLAGTGTLLPKNGTRLRRNQTTVTFGLPLRAADGETARRFGSRVERAVATLAAESATDWWTARRQLAEGTVVDQAQGPQVAPWRRAWAHGPQRTDPDRTPLSDPRRWSVDRP